MVEIKVTTKSQSFFVKGYHTHAKHWETSTSQVSNVNISLIKMHEAPSILSNDPYVSPQMVNPKGCLSFMIAMIDHSCAKGSWL